MTSEIDAAIISDMALMDICASEAPGLPIHLSTQSSAANYETLNFWKSEGLERVKLAREVSMEEIKEMQEKWMSKLKHSSRCQCIPYSGRCVLSNHGTSLMRTVVDVRNLCR